MSAASRCPTRGSTSSREIAKSAQIIPTQLEFVDIAGLVRGASKGEGPRQPVPRQHPRGRRDRPRAALLRGRRRHPCRGHGRPDRRRRDGRDRADARRPRQPRAARARPREEGAAAATRRRRSRRSMLGQALDAAARGQAGAAGRAARTRRSARRFQRAAAADRQAGALRLQRRRRRCRRPATRCPSAVFEQAPRRKAPRRSSSPPRSRPRSPTLPRRRARRIPRPTSASHETGLNRVIRAGYELLGLITFFTAGPKEARAWTVHQRRQGARGRRRDPHRLRDAASSAPRPSPTTISSRCGGEAGATDAGKLRSEGKEYVVQDGDVLLFRFAP